MTTDATQHTCTPFPTASCEPPPEPPRGGRRTRRVAAMVVVGALLAGVVSWGLVLPPDAEAQTVVRPRRGSKPTGTKVQVFCRGPFRMKVESRKSTFSISAPVANQNALKNGRCYIPGVPRTNRYNVEITDASMRAAALQCALTPGCELGFEGRRSRTNVIQPYFAVGVNRP